MKNHLFFFLLLIAIYYYYNSDTGLSGFISKNPLPTQDLKVLILRETSDQYKLEPEQNQALNSIIIDEYIISNNGLVLKLDKDQPIVNDTEGWFTKARQYINDKPLPYIVVSKGNSLREGKINNIDEVLDMLKSVK